MVWQNSIWHVVTETVSLTDYSNVEMTVNDGA